MSEKDLIGQRFGRLIVVEKASPDKSGRIRWRCRCDCGKETISASTRLLNGKSRSCGCLQRDRAKECNLTHGLTKQKLDAPRIPRIYRIWANMKTRCTNPKAPYYSRYGGRGIKVCQEWMNSFETFYKWAISHGYNDNLSIDRIDNNGDYTPENCRWVTAKKQQNNKSNSLIIEYHGEEHTAAEWAKITGLSLKTIYTRHRAGKTPEEILKK